MKHKQTIILASIMTLALAVMFVAGITTGIKIQKDSFESAKAEEFRKTPQPKSNHDLHYDRVYHSIASNR